MSGGGDDDVIADGLEVAERLRLALAVCDAVAAAHPGQILATNVVRAVAGSRAGVEFTDLGPLDLKGVAEAVPVCEVVWEPLGAAVPLPSLLSGTGRIFVGRGSELDRLDLLAHAYLVVTRQAARWQEVAEKGAPTPGRSRSRCRRCAAWCSPWVRPRSGGRSGSAGRGGGGPTRRSPPAATRHGAPSGERPVLPPAPHHRPY